MIINCFYMIGFKNIQILVQGFVIAYGKSTRHNICISTHDVQYIDGIYRVS